ncbi:MAG: ribosomal protein S18-alanine N-acetyltransferase [Bacillota bacterium]|nr:ribosomal protein S18-alanine N-acetyltransferase [Bacillota bacterium]
MSRKISDESIIRPLGIGDIGTVELMEQECFSAPWSRDSLISDIVLNPNARYIGMEKGNRIVAYAGMWVAYDQAHITNIAVTTGERRKGIGTLLIERLIQMARSLGVASMTLEVRVSNLPAHAMYGKLGFYIASVRKKYYFDNGEDAYLMCKDDVQSGQGLST